MQDNFTDQALRACYNAQACVDEAQQMIVAVGVTNCAADSTQLVPMIEAIEANTDEVPRQVLADSGYRSEANFQQLERSNIDGVIALGREGKADAAPISESCPAIQRMKEKLQTSEGAAAYRRRKVIPEPVFGWIKHVLGFRQFSFRGLNKNNAEWHLSGLAINLRRMSGGMLARVRRQLELRGVLPHARMLPYGLPVVPLISFSLLVASARRGHAMLKRRARFPHRYTMGRRLTRDGKRVPLVRVSGRWLEAFGFKEGAKYTAIGVEGGLLVLTVYEAAPGGGTSRPETSRALDAQDDALPPRKLE